MHVLLTPSWFPEFKGDVSGSFFREQAIALADHGLQVGVIAPQAHSIWHKSSFPRNAGLTQERDEGVQVLRYGYKWPFGRLHSLSAFRWLQVGERLFDAYVKERGLPDVIHGHALLDGGVLASRLSAKSGVPFLVTEHSTAYARGLVTGRMRRRAFAASQDASALIAVSPEFAKTLESFFPGGRRWACIPNMVDKRFLCADIEPTKIGPRVGFHFANVGLMTEKKGQDVLLRAFAMAFKDQHGVELTLAGAGPLQGGLMDLAKDLGIIDQVEFVGRASRDEVLGLLQRCDSFVLASRVETFGVSVVEALALGVPVIATRSGGPESIISDGDGFLVAPNSVPELADAMKKMIAERERFDPHAIRRRCADRYAEEVVVESLARAYKAAVEVAYES